MDKETFSNNLKKLADKYSQKRIALDTGFSQASITNYINKSSEPSLSFLIKLKSVYNINLDDFLGNDNYNFNKDLQNEKYLRFIGNYIIYYYDSGAYKGRVNSFSKNTLSYGVVSVFHDILTKNIKTKALFLLSRKEAESIISDLNNKNDDKYTDNFFNTCEYSVYNGKIDCSNMHLFIQMVNSEYNDHCYIILNNPPSINKYIGGIGCVNSISRGREQMPCVQYLILSKNIINKPDGEIYNLLTLGIPDINLGKETEQVVNLFKSLYLEKNDALLNLNDYQKENIIENTLKNMLFEQIESNLFRFAKISDMEDDAYYRLIKEEYVDD